MVHTWSYCQQQKLAQWRNSSTFIFLPKKNKTKQKTHQKQFLPPANSCPIPKHIPSEALFYFLYFLREWLHFVVLFPERLTGLDEQGYTAAKSDIFMARKKKKEWGKQGSCRGEQSCSWHITGSQYWGPTFNGKPQGNVLEGLTGIIVSTSRLRIHSVHPQASRGCTHLPKWLFGEKILHRDICTHR